MLKGHHRISSTVVGSRIPSLLRIQPGSNLDHPGSNLDRPGNQVPVDPIARAPGIIRVDANKFPMLTATGSLLLSTFLQVGSNKKYAAHRWLMYGPACKAVFLRMTRMDPALLYV